MKIALPKFLYDTIGACTKYYAFIIHVLFFVGLILYESIWSNGEKSLTKLKRHDPSPKNKITDGMSKDNVYVITLH